MNNIKISLGVCRYASLVIILLGAILLTLGMVPILKSIIQGGPQLIGNGTHFMLIINGVLPIYYGAIGFKSLQTSKKRVK